MKGDGKGLWLSEYGYGMLLVGIVSIIYIQFKIK